MTLIIIASVLITLVVSVYIGIWIKNEIENFRDGSVDEKESKVLYVAKTIAHGLVFLWLLCACVVTVLHNLGSEFAGKVLYSNLDIAFIVVFLGYVLLTVLEHEINKEK
jgi:hypothetical protein